MNLTEQIASMVKMRCPRYYKTLVGICRGLKSEDLDYLTIFSGMEGSGKSNNVLLTNYTMAYLLKKDISIQDNFFFSGASYLYGLEEIMEQVMEVGDKYVPIEMDDDGEEYKDFKKHIDKVSLPELEKIKQKYKWHFWALDEGQDLMHLDFINRFNKQFTKIMMSIRESNMIFSIAYPDLTMLNRYLRQFRVKMFNYCFLLRDGSRNMATYTRRNYIRILRDNPKNIQMNLLLPDVFINRYHPDFITQGIPKFPKNNNEYRNYLKLKRLSTASLVLRGRKQVARGGGARPKAK